MHEVNEIFQPSHYLSKFITHGRWLAMRTLLCQRPSYMIHCLNMLDVFHKIERKTKRKMHICLLLFSIQWGYFRVTYRTLWIGYFLWIFHCFGILVYNEFNNIFFSFFLSYFRENLPTTFSFLGIFENPNAKLLNLDTFKQIHEKWFKRLLGLLMFSFMSRMIHSKLCCKKHNLTEFGTKQ